MRKLRFTLALAAAALAGWRWAAVPPGDGPAQAEGAPASAGPAPRAVLELPQRAGLSVPSRDLFGVPPRPEPVRASAAAEPPAVPQAPPLPYQYDGSGVVQGKSFVYLKRQDRSIVVSSGDTLEGTYSVEAVARDHVVLRYLPLGIRQVLLYSIGEAPPEVASMPGSARPVALQVDMPAEVAVGQEFVITVALPGAGALKATIEVGYDHEVLRMVGPGVRSAGRALVELASGNAARAQLRFKVLAETPTPTDIDLQVDAMDASGRHIPVSTPPTHTVSLVLPGGG